MDFNAALNDLDGKPLTFAEDNEDKPLTVGRAAVLALLNSECQDQEEKFARWELARAIRAGTAKLKAEDIVRIKKCANSVWGTVVYGPLVVALEPEE